MEGAVQDQNGTLLHLMLDHLEERRQQIQIRIVAYQQQIRVVHHKKVKSREFQINNMVLKRVILGNFNDKGKLRPNWEDPYLIIARRGNGSYTFAN